MDVTLQKHGAKYKCNVPEGLSELCADISREVLSDQPKEIYSFIADYVDALLITRENVKIADKVVNNILSESEAVIEVLLRTGVPFEKIALVASNLQEAFRTYLDTESKNCNENCRGKYWIDSCAGRESIVSIEHILEECGTSLEIATRAATLIQATFRGHCERMIIREKKGEIQWQRAVVNTMEILKKAGVSQSDATKTATIIQSVYRGYYSRRNRKMRTDDETRKTGHEKSILNVTWLEMICEDSGVTEEQAHEAARIIQHVYRQHSDCRDKKMIAGSITKEIFMKVFDKIFLNIPDEIQSSFNVTESTERITQYYRERVRDSPSIEAFADFEIKSVGVDQIVEAQDANAVETYSEQNKEDLENVENGTAKSVQRENSEERKNDEQSNLEKEASKNEIVEPASTEEEEEKTLQKNIEEETKSGIQEENEDSEMNENIEQKTKSEVEESVEQEIKSGIESIEEIKPAENELTEDERSKATLESLATIEEKEEN